MIVKKDIVFAGKECDETSFVYQITPSIFKDSRGSFSEVLKETNESDISFLHNLSWIKQINRSISSPGVIRGMHAQSGMSCQAKLVEAITGHVFDVITDARPDSSTFGVSNIYHLDSKTQTKLFVPRGFLHGFIVPLDSQDNTIFNYYCDNVYDKGAEIGINPTSIIPQIVDNIKTLNPNYDVFCSLYNILETECTYSDKDITGLDYESFMSDMMGKYLDNGVLWYK